jgi:hypothetical protein
MKELVGLRGLGMRGLGKTNAIFWEYFKQIWTLARPNWPLARPKRKNMIWLVKKLKKEGYIKIK